MRFFSLLCFCFLALSQLNAQFGVAVKYDRNSYSEWNNEMRFLEKGDIYGSDITIGINYWKSLKDKRVDFLPELTYSIKNSISVSYPSPPSFPSPDIIYESRLQRFGFIFNTHVYPMDFSGDCNCPTFSKQNDFFKKGLFFILSPGVEYFKSAFVINDHEQTSYSNLALKLGAGIGLDIGISNLLTISPFAMFNYYPKMINGSAVNNLVDIIVVDKTSNLQTQFGIRLTFRPDYKY